MLELTFDLHTYWHVGTGRGDAALADAVVARTPEGLPYLPGRTVKGLLRSAAELACRAGQLQAEQVTRLFGAELASRSVSGTDRQDAADASDKLLEAGRFRSGAESALYFASATLPEPWANWAANAAAEGSPTPAEIKAALYYRLASTRIDADGVAKDQTLRTIEVAVPMKLSSVIQGLPGAPSGWEHLILGLCPLVRELGVGRSRGLGRVTLSGRALS